MRLVTTKNTMKQYVIYQDAEGGQYVKGDIGGGYTINYNDGSHWDYCSEKEIDILAKTEDTGEVIKLDHYPCNMTKVLAIENFLDDESLAFLHKLDTFSKIPRLQELNKINDGLSEVVKYVFNLGEYLKNNVYISDVCLDATDSLKCILNEIRYGVSDPLKHYNLTFDEYYLFNQIVNDQKSLYKIGNAASAYIFTDPEMNDKWYKVYDDLEELE